ncbi:hypothetical protein MM221_06265 [Salipaludibacillus sp. LMS25]|nr:hypothetical protein [Salipaludibacillus sp. LMS25]UTR16161.1 hypothetical protein MM221_06265 [Salipaludibacillus sp. LMS25]
MLLAGAELTAYDPIAAGNAIHFMPAGVIILTQQKTLSKEWMLRLL